MPTWAAPVTPSEPLAAVVLAAGRGARMGGMVKPLIPIAGHAIVERLVQSLQSAGIERMVVVISPHTQSVRQTLTRVLAESACGPSFVEVPAGHDQMHSLHQGLQSLGQEPVSVMVCLADQPLLDAQALADLRVAFLDRPPHTDMVVPCVNGQPGNPVVLSARLVQAWQLDDERLIGKAWRDTYPERVYRWPTLSAAYITDLDTPADLEAFLRHAP